MFKNIKGVTNVIVQDKLEYDDVLYRLKPDYVVHGDDWVTGYQARIRERVIEVLKEWNGQLIEFPYSNTVADEIINSLDQRLSMPETGVQD